MKAEESMDRSLNMVLNGVMGAMGYTFAMLWKEWPPILGFVLVAGVAMMRAIYLSGVIAGDRK